MAQWERSKDKSESQSVLKSVLRPRLRDPYCNCSRISHYVYSTVHTIRPYRSLNSLLTATLFIIVIHYQLCPPISNAWTTTSGEWRDAIVLNYSVHHIQFGETFVQCRLWFKLLLSNFIFLQSEVRCHSYYGQKFVYSCRSVKHFSSS